MLEDGERGGHDATSASPKTEDVAPPDTQSEVGACQPVMVATEWTSHSICFPDYHVTYASMQKANAVCRVCLEEDSLDTLKQPCSCSGSMQVGGAHTMCLSPQTPAMQASLIALPGTRTALFVQYVHPDCLQTWINEKGSKSCEVCQQAYQVIAYCLVQYHHMSQT